MAWINGNYHQSNFAIALRRQWLLFERRVRRAEVALFKTFIVRC